ncbi:MAG: type II toxin-antitoxin system VapC family toxin [Bacillati bacterium ANGP1]|uniref:Ribonuclease VapC n=1 Tax=Candidatus Segetimicrobium genomatis TaxID=2569760 RepID=A0A537LK28_9BACT|nr:MAG: type II toxin-antitoxin system VapC family toxin [Terrabacteria group bacterium ANGP1]
MRIGSKRRRGGPIPLPGPVYCDASAVAKVYLPEPGSDNLNRALKGRRDLFVSDLAVTEIVSAIARRLREGAISSEQALRLQRAILADLDAGYFRRIDLTPVTHRQAEQFLLALPTVALRAADALHLALAVAAGAVAILTYDRRLTDAARAVGLAPFPSAV